jgi:transcription termination factor Rho
MAMPEFNHMAREMGIENFGTMRKHELIFQILQKNAERAGVLFSEGVLEFCRKASAFCARAASIICRARRTFTFPLRKSAVSTCKPAT